MATLLSFVPALAEPGPASQPCTGDLKRARATLYDLEANGKAVILRDLKGEAAHLWIAGLNAVPPHSDLSGDAVMAVAVTWTGNVLVGVYRGGCTVANGELAADVYQIIDEAVTQFRGAGA